MTARPGSLLPLLLIAIAPALVLDSGQVASTQSTGVRFNIISIVTDDQSKWSVGSYGNRESVTPNMDRLAREGARFLNAFVATPVCSPSRAAFLTGLYPTQVGITDYISAEEGQEGVGLPRVMTWPGLLQRAGYRTGLFGKWHLGTKPQFHPSRHGFDYFFGSLAGSFAPVNPRLELDGKLTQLEGAGADLVMDQALRFVETSKDRPFAALIHFREPHLPYTPVPPEDSAPFAKLDPTIPQVRGLDTAQVKQFYREYYAAIHSVDRNLGRLLRRLDELDLTRRTIVLFTSDHGYNIGQHGIHTKGNGISIMGGVNGPTRPNMWDTSISVPLIVRWPGTVQPGLEVAEAVVNVDTFASVAGMLGINVPRTVRHEGRDFSLLLRGRKPAWREAVFGQYDLHNGALAYMRMIRKGDWKLVRHSYVRGRDELYDLKADPEELRNLYNDERHKGTRDELDAQLGAWMRSIGDPLAGGRASGRRRYPGGR